MITTARIPLVNVVEQFEVVLSAMPFVSDGSKRKALDALRDFGKKDVGSVIHQVGMSCLGILVLA